MRHIRVSPKASSLTTTAKDRQRFASMTLAPHLNSLTLYRQRPAPTIHPMMAIYQALASYPRSIKTRDRLLKGARTLFLLKGLASVTVDDICLAAAVSKGGFYHHFADKESAFLEVALEELKRAMELPTPPAPGAAETRGSTLLIDLWAWAPRHPSARRRVRALHRRALRRLSRFPRQAAREKQSKGDREAQAALVLFVGIGRVVPRAMAGRPAVSRRGRGKTAAG